MTVSRAWITPSLRRKERETMLKGWFNGLLKLKFQESRRLPSPDNYASCIKMIPCFLSRKLLSSSTGSAVVVLRTQLGALEYQRSEWSSWSTFLIWN